MNRILRGTAVAALILALLVGIWVFDRPPADESQQPAAAAETDRYLGIWDGRLALFASDSPQPTEVYDVWIAALPPAEQQRLADGVTVEDDSALAALLTDYGS